MLQSRSKRVLWVDDEIESLKSHVFSLSTKGYELTPVSNGDDALSLLQEEEYDAVLLDQVMPGQDGITTLAGIRQLRPLLPVIMVTQSSNDRLIDEALAKQVTDFLVKPLTPGQIASTLRRVLAQPQLVAARMPQEYVSIFSEIQLAKQQDPGWREWIDIYRRICQWDVHFDHTEDQGLNETHVELKRECNALFSRYVESNYTSWLRGRDTPPLSVNVLEKFVAPHLQSGRPVYFVVIDCLRLDQWLTIQPLLEPYFSMEQEHYYSILPSATLYSRNAIFSGLYPKQIADRYPEFWQEDPEEETSTNRYEKQLMRMKLAGLGLNLKPEARYFKIFDARGSEEYFRQVSTVHRISLSALVVNFVDILTHKRSQLDILQEIAPDESAFRSLTLSWFSHSALLEIFKVMAQKKDVVVVVTSDHGSVLGNRASRVFGNRETTTSLRFKTGDDLGCNRDEAMYVTKPQQCQLPAETARKDYIFAKEDYYFVYPNQFHEYKRQFRGGFQHGGISLEELILPVVTMTPRH